MRRNCLCGVVLSKEGKTSRECDVIVYRECDVIVYNVAEYGPLFKSGEIVVISPEAVRCVVEVKGTLTNSHLLSALKNLSSVNELRIGIWKLIVGLNTNIHYQSLVNRCVQSKTVNGIFIFNSTCQSEKEDISLQMQKFVGLLKEITLPAAHQKCDAGDYVALEVTESGELNVEHFPT